MSGALLYGPAVESSIAGTVVNVILLVADVTAIAYCLHGARQDRRAKNQLEEARESVGHAR